jgi:imidazoleglycerol-phosphate dehydratase
MSTRTAEVVRKTRETNISVTINIDGVGNSSVKTPIPFLNHMLELFSRHGFFDLNVNASGDTDVDYHHTMEDLGMVLGEAFDKALGDRKGIRRYGSFLLPMDETLVMVALDLSGRAGLYYDVQPPAAQVKDIDSQLFCEFWRAFSNRCGLNMHIKMLCSAETHHLFEAIFKGVAKALDQAVSFDERIDGVLSTKGSLDL